MNFKLRKLTLDDSGSIAKYANNINIANNLRDAFPHQYSIADAEEFINNLDNSIVLAIDVNGDAVGCIGLTFKEDIHFRTVELGYWLGEDFWNNGIISKAINEVVNWAFNGFNNIKTNNMDVCGFNKYVDYEIARIYAEPFSNNIRSQKALEKAGFVLEGVLRNNVYKNGKLLDSCIYGIIK
ncbi:MAG: GNAT family N-acetyltransferase [Methanobacteriaceae archaeon]